MIHLTRTDDAKNMARFYCVSVQRDLFGAVSLVKEWGRIGTGGTLRHEHFSDEAAADHAAQKLITAKIRKGYARIA